MIHLVLFLYIVLIFIAIVAVLHFTHQRLDKPELSSYQPPEIDEQTTEEELLNLASECLIHQDLVTFESIVDKLVDNYQISMTKIIQSLNISFQDLCNNKSYSSICYLLKNHRSIVESKFDDSSAHKDFLDDIIEMNDTVLLAIVLPLIQDRVNLMNIDNFTTPLAFALLQKPINPILINMLFDHGAKSFIVGNHDLQNHVYDKILLPSQIIKRFEHLLMKFELAFFRMIATSINN